MSKYYDWLSICTDDYAALEIFLLQNVTMLLTNEFPEEELLGASGNVVVEVDCGWIGGNKTAGVNQ